MAGGRRKQRYAASNLDPSWNVQDQMPGEGGQFFIPAEAAAERPDQAIDAQSPTISRQVTPHSDAFSLPRATPAPDQQPITQQLQAQSQSPSHLEVLELPVTRGSTPSRHSRDGEESASTVSSSAPSRSAKGKKKRYVTALSRLGRGGPCLSSWSQSWALPTADPGRDAASAAADATIIVNSCTAPRSNDAIVHGHDVPCPLHLPRRRPPDQQPGTGCACDPAWSAVCVVASVAVHRRGTARCSSSAGAG